MAEWRETDGQSPAFGVLAYSVANRGLGRERPEIRAILNLTRLVRMEDSVNKPSPKKAPDRTEWQLQEAKARFSEVFRMARERGPQRVTKHGRAAVVVIQAEEYERLSNNTRRGSLLQFFAESPLAGLDLKIERPRDLGRKIGL